MRSEIMGRSTVWILGREFSLKQQGLEKEKGVEIKVLNLSEGGEG